MRRSVPKIAVIGCGAVTERRHLPALAALGVKPVLLVDPNLRRAEDLGRAFGVPRFAESYEPWIGEFDAAIVAAPHSLHASVSTDLLRRGIHVLVEKPMALTKTECDAINRMARESKAVLAVGLIRRFLHVARWVKAALSAGVLGRVESFEVTEGSVYGWPVASDFFFRKETAGGGVLADTGAHTLDLLLWWLGDVASFEYFDDSYGGVEADCKLHLKLAGGPHGNVELSRTRNLPRVALLRGERGEIEVSLDEKRFNHIMARPREILSFRNGGRRGDRLPRQRMGDLFRLQLEDWLHAVETGGEPSVSGAEGARSVALIEACYKERRLLDLPWVRSDPLPSAIATAGSP